MSKPDLQEIWARILASRAKWGPPPPPGVQPQSPQPGQESVWDYPRPPEVRPAEARIRAYLGQALVLESQRALRICETAGAPVYYAPPDDWVDGVLSPSGAYTVCEWKGVATTLDAAVPGAREPGAAFVYEHPLTDLGQGYEQIKGWPGPHPAVLRCYLGDEEVQPQPGLGYAGWVTSRVVGPVKGDPGTGHW